MASIAEIITMIQLGGTFARTMPFAIAVRAITKLVYGELIEERALFFINQNLPLFIDPSEKEGVAARVANLRYFITGSQITVRRNGKVAARNPAKAVMQNMYVRSGIDEIDAVFETDILTLDKIFGKNIHFRAKCIVGAAATAII